MHAPWLLNSNVIFNGFRGVDLFFVLSAFILMHVHGGDFANLSQKDIKTFYIARFFRVYPLNMAVMLLFLAFVLVCPTFVTYYRMYSDPHFAYHAREYSVAGFIRTVPLVQTWTILKLGEWNVVSWTLSAEVLGYALFPAMAWIIRREYCWYYCMLYAFASLATLTALLFAFGHADNNPTGVFGAIRMLGCFTAGVCLYRGYELIPHRLRNLGTPLTIASLAFIAGTLVSPVLPVFDVFGFAVLILGLAFRQGPINAFLQSRVPMFVGKVSFSFYLSHWPIVLIITWWLSDWLASLDLIWRTSSILAFAALCFGTGTALYYLVERPWQRIGRRIAMPHVKKQVAVHVLAAECHAVVEAQ